MPDLAPSEEAEDIARRGWRTHLGDQREFDRELSKVLRDAASEGQRAILRIVGDGVGAEARRSQLRLAIETLRVQADGLWGGSISSAISRGIDRTTQSAVVALLELDMALAGAIADQGLATSLLAASQSAMDNVRSRILNGIRLSDKVYKTEAIANGWIEREINRGILLGRSAKEIARSVAKYINPNTPGGVSYAAKRLGRTELNNAFHTTTIRAAQDKPWVVGFKWNLSGSHPRKDECNEYAEKDHDGLGDGIFSKRNVPMKPHPQCLCYVTTVDVGEDEFLDALVAGKYDKFMRENGSAI